MRLLLILGHLPRKFIRKEFPAFRSSISPFKINLQNSVSYALWINIRYPFLPVDFSQQNINLLGTPVIGSHPNRQLFTICASYSRCCWWYIISRPVLWIAISPIISICDAQAGHIDTVVTLFGIGGGYSRSRQMNINTKKIICFRVPRQNIFARLNIKILHNTTHTLANELYGHKRLWIAIMLLKGHSEL